MGSESRGSARRLRRGDNPATALTAGAFVTRLNGMNTPKPARRRGKASELERQIIESIRSGRYPADSAIPSLRELSREYGVHYNTAHSVIKRLAAKGLVNSIGRRGVFVSKMLQGTLEQPSGRAVGAGTLSAVAALGVMYVEAVALDRRNNDYGIVRAVEAAASELGSRVYYYDLSRPNLEDAAGVVRRCVADGVSGVLVIGMRDTEPLGPLLAELEAKNIPCVMCPLGRQSIAVTTHTPVVDVDDRLAGVVAAQHLYDLGHRQLAMVTYDRLRPYIDQRIAGFSAVCHLNHLSLDPGQVIRLPVAEMHPPEYYRVGFEGFSRLDGSITGVFGVNDCVAAGLIDAAIAAGHEVGKTLSVVGHDNDEAYQDKQISTIVPPLAQIGRRAVTVLGELLSGRTNSDRIVLRSQLIWRRSSGMLQQQPAA